MRGQLSDTKVISQRNDFRANLRRNATVINGARRAPLLTRAMRDALNMGICSLTFYVLLWVLGCAGLMTVMFYNGECYNADLSIWNGYMLSVSLILGGGGPSINETGKCAVFSLFSTAVAFATDIGVIAVFVNKVTNPQSDVLFSENVVVRSRDGKTILQFRFMNSFGHAMLNVEVKVFYYFRVESAEGEKYTAIVELPVECANFGGAYPLNINVSIDENTPLWGEDFSNFSGQFHVSLTGFDASLQIDITRDRWYSVESLRVGHEHKPCFDKHFADAVATNSHMEISLENFHSTVKLPEEMVECLLNTLEKRREEKARRRAEVMQTCTLHTARGTPEEHNDKSIVEDTVKNSPVLLTPSLVPKKKSVLKRLKLR